MTLVRPHIEFAVQALSSYLQKDVSKLEKIQRRATKLIASESLTMNSFCPQILRNHVMVRVGGGWDTLEHYLDKHDPCRCKSGKNRLSWDRPRTGRVPCRALIPDPSPRHQPSTLSRYCRCERDPSLSVPTFERSGRAAG